MAMEGAYDIYACFGHITLHALLCVWACKEGRYTNSAYFSVYSVAECMGLPNFRVTPKMDDPLGTLGSDAMGS